MGVPVTAKSREASDHQTPVLYSPTVHAGAQQGSHAPHGRRQPIPAWARAAIADGASTGSTRRSARARARESAVVGDASTGEGSTRRLRRERRQGHQGLGTAARMSNVCVCVYPTARGRSHSTRQGSGYESLDGTQRYGCADVVFCSTFLQHLETYTTIAKRISRILGPFRSAPFSAPLRRHYMAFR